MSNPIYLLHLSDWHLSSNNIHKYQNSAGQPFEKLMTRLKESLERFLAFRGRNHFDFITITGDMMDKNGSTEKEGQKNHNLAANILKELLSDLRNEQTKVYTAPGNHDIDFKLSDDFLSKNHNAKNTIFGSEGYPNYKVVDNHIDKLSLNFEKYEDFANNIMATNKQSPLLGYDIVNLGDDINFFISWFNTSWLSRNNWHNYCKNMKIVNGVLMNDDEIEEEEKENAVQVINENIKKKDEGHISAGNRINDDVFRAFNEYANTGNLSFSLSLFHHYPRLLNWHDIYTLKEGKNLSFYEKVKRNSLVLNGHTHGKLFDFPFSTTTGLLAFESYYLDRVVSVIEIDPLRNYYIIHQIPYGDDARYKDDHEKVFRVFNDNTFIDNFRSNYTSKDLFYDLKYNKGVFHDLPESSSFHKLLGKFDVTDEHIDSLINNQQFNRADLIKDPLFKEKVNSELMSIKHRSKFIKKS